MKPTDADAHPRVWDVYRSILGGYENGGKDFIRLEKPDFYERARRAYAIVATTESALFSNIILRKGVITR